MEILDSPKCSSWRNLKRNDEIDLSKKRFFRFSKYFICGGLRL
ncbi:hypothetical protein [Helicobacter sp. 16-1353]|nr:hypothetical protein [Helicobacter sp. 16-1353]